MVYKCTSLHGTETGKIEYPDFFSTIPSKFLLTAALHRYSPSARYKVNCFGSRQEATIFPVQSMHSHTQIHTYLSVEMSSGFFVFRKVLSVIPY